MAATYSYPGVYVEEIPSDVRTIVGVSTSNTAFVDFFARGPLNQPVRITSLGDFERTFGGLDTRSEASYAIKQYYLNGGQIAFVVRTTNSASPAQTAKMALVGTVNGGAPVRNLVFTAEAINAGEWGNSLQVAIDYNTAVDPTTNLPRPNEFNLVVRQLGVVSGRNQVLRSEILRNLSMDKASPRYAVDTVAAGSLLIRLVEGASAGVRPDATTNAAVPDVTNPAIISDPTSGNPLIGGSGYSNPNYVFRSPADPTMDDLIASDQRVGKDGALPGPAELIAGIHTLDTIAPEIFNLLCVPLSASLDAPSAGNAFDTPNLRSVVADATRYCRDKRAFLLVDVPAAVTTQASMMAWMGTNEEIRDRNAAVYFPRVFVPDLLNEGRPRNAGASGTVAGLYAATDANRGVWKAPAGTEAALTGASLTAKLSDLENGGLNPFGINVLRTFPIFGSVVWGARTLEGADIQASEWKYIPVRRTALFIEETLFQGLKWVVFEPNDETLWAQIRLNVGAFMHNLFRQGAFQGTSPTTAYLVKCDSETTTQIDIDAGVVNILVGFAPLKPAEFVVIQIQQLTGQIPV